MNEEELKRIKKLNREKSNIIIGLLSAILVINICQFIYEIKSDIGLHKKIDFRYFNTTRSLEDIHQVSIDTKDGKIKFNHPKD